MIVGRVSKLVLYVQSTGTVISGRYRVTERQRKSNDHVTKQGLIHRRDRRAALCTVGKEDGIQKAKKMSPLLNGIVNEACKSVVLP